MAKLTRREQIISLLEARGWRQVGCNSRKYIKLIKSGSEPYWVGKNGAVRVGSTIADSTSMTAYFDWTNPADA